MKCHRQGIIPWKLFFPVWVQCLFCPPENPQLVSIHLEKKEVSRYESLS